MLVGPLRYVSGMKKRFLLAGVFVLLLLGVVVVDRNNKESNRREQALVTKGKAEEVCREIKQLADRKSIEDMESRFWIETVKPIAEKVSSKDFQIIKNIVSNCAYEEKKKYPKDTVPANNVTQESNEPNQSSDAELLAEGKSCSQQWRHARAESLSGTSDDSRLRATVHACKTLDEWILGAVENEEYSEYLLAAICASEPNAPDAICG